MLAKVGLDVAVATSHIAEPTANPGPRPSCTVAGGRGISPRSYMETVGDGDYDADLPTTRPDTGRPERVAGAGPYPATERRAESTALAP